MDQRGVTLVEMLVVVVILGLLATLASKWVFRAGDRAERRIALIKCREYHDAVHVWKLERGRLPGSLRDLEAPLAPGEGPFLHVDPDPWGRPFRLEIDRTEVRIWSDGPDRLEGTSDDICYVPEQE